MTRINWLIASSTLFVAACQSGTGANTYPADAPQTITILANDPTKGQPGKCWAKEAVVLLEQSGRRTVKPVKTAAFRDVWFQVPCADNVPYDFIQNLQRALKSRGLYNGVIDGVMGGDTRKAVHKYQATRGLDSDVLSMNTALQLGLIAYPRPENE